MMLLLEIFVIWWLTVFFAHLFAGLWVMFKDNNEDANHSHLQSKK